MSTSFEYVMFNFLIAVIGYMLLPLIWSISGKQYTIKQIKKRIILNGVIVYSFFVILGGGNGTAAFVWSSVAYWMMKKNCLKDEPMENVDAVNSIAQEVEFSTTPTIILGATGSFCKKCGNELTEDSAYCRFCGKKVKKPKEISTRRIVLVAVLLLLIIIFSVFSVFLIINYQNAITAMDNQEFISAKLHFDKIPYSEQLFPDEYSYINAFVLLESGEYLQAYEALENLSLPVPSSVIEDLSLELYMQAVQYYRSGKYSKAVPIFTALDNYKQSEDYILLIQIQNTANSKYYKDLIGLIGFEDAKDILTKYSSYFDKFIKGEWKTTDSKYFFKIDYSGEASHNLPADYNSSDYYTIADGIYYNGAFWNNESQRQFKFTIIDQNTIAVFCYKNNQNYRLIRQ